MGHRRTRQFLSTLSLRRATEQQLWQNINTYISIHALLAESDSRHFAGVPEDCNFYPRSPCGERPYIRDTALLSTHFYPRSPCGERRMLYDTSSLMKCISIHALLAESDPERHQWPDVSHHLYPRSPCGERPQAIYPSSTPPKFLSTLSLRRATVLARNWFTRSFHFYPRSPCGERHHKQAQSMYHNTISIHALLAESDSAAVRLAVLSYYISIHALLAESDHWCK